MTNATLRRNAAFQMRLIVAVEDYDEVGRPTSPPIRVAFERDGSR